MTIHPTQEEENWSLWFLAIYVNSECSSSPSFIILLLFLSPSAYQSPERSLGLSHPPSPCFGRTQSLCKIASQHVPISALVPPEERQERSGVGKAPRVGCCSLPGPVLLSVNKLLRSSPNGNWFPSWTPLPGTVQESTPLLQEHQLYFSFVLPWSDDATQIQFISWNCWETKNFHSSKPRDDLLWFESMAVDDHGTIAFLPWDSLKDVHCLEDCYAQPMTSFWELEEEEWDHRSGDNFTTITLAPKHP